MRADILFEVLTAQVWKSSFPAYECPVCCADGAEWVCRGHCPDASWTSCGFEEGSHGVCHNVVQEDKTREVNGCNVIALLLAGEVERRGLATSQ